MPATTKNYTVKFEKSPYNENYYLCKITFKVTDGVSMREITEAMLTINPIKLVKAFDAQGVQVFVKGGMLLGSISKETFEKGKATLTKHPTPQN